MKIKLLAIGITLVFLIVGLSGCTNTQESNKHITPPQTPKHILNGWYYLRDIDCFDIELTSRSLIFYMVSTIFPNERTIRLIASSYDNNGIDVNLVIDGTIVHNFKTSNSYLDEEYTISSYYMQSVNYVMMISSEYTQITLLEYFSFEVFDFMLNPCRLPRKYL